MATTYIVFNAFDIKDSLKADGAKWDADRKGWIITQPMLDKYNARTQSYGMRWINGWAKTTVKALVAA